MSIDLYHSPSSRPCRSVRLVAKAIGLEMNEKVMRLSSKDHLKPEFIKINPQHCLPTLDDNGFVIWESHAILGYLVDRYAKDDSLYPKDPRKRALVNQRLYFDVSLYQKFADHYHPVYFTGADSDPVKLEKFQETFGLLDKFLEGQMWVAGDKLTIADIAFVTTVSTFEIFDFNVSKYPNVDKWYAKAKQTIDGYCEINHAGCMEFKKKLESAPVKSNKIAK